jgi:hypothetical protein
MIDPRRVRGRAGHADAISSNFAALCTWWMLNAAEFGAQAQGNPADRAIPGTNHPWREADSPPVGER